MKQKKVLITAKNVHKTFFVKAQNIEVLSDVSLSVWAGDFLIIFGPSGCGKSTLLHILLGLEAPTKGEVIFLDKSLYGALSEDDRSEIRKEHVGMVYQQPNWIRSLTVKENIMFALRLSGMSASQAAAKAVQSLSLVGMTDWQDYIPTELSSGQQQKVALARAVVTNPDIIIADEPTGNLDFESGQELMELLSSFHKQGKTIIMVTHDLEYLEYAMVSLRMFNGKIVEEIADPISYVHKNKIHLKRGSEGNQ